MVPAMAPYTAQDFCVAQSEMTIQGNPNGLVPYVSTMVPISAPNTGTPMINLVYSQAVSACQSLGPNYNLISNDQWQSTARNIEGVASNWSSGQAGVGDLNSGLYISDYGFLPASVTDPTNPCTDTRSTCDFNTWSSERRTSALSNGAIIWDFGGNAFEWVIDSTYAPGDFANVANTYAVEISDPAYNAKYGPAGTYAIDSLYNGLGYARANSASSGPNIMRGAGGGLPNGGGIFSTTLGIGGTTKIAGFRCVTTPQ
jgi:hypothetical protein